ncbi:MAG TPA: hypothetical protein DCW42_01415 [Bacteroidetes bacterium]|nr:hypothetical protein [Bacteroidota bacterium]
MCSRKLYDAVRNGDIGLVRYLIASGADINAENDDNAIPLIGAIESKYNYLVKLLLDGGADVNIEDKNGMTPLKAAIRFEQKDVIELLLEKGADINAEDKKGRTPLISAIINDQKNMVKFLIDRGANIDFGNNDIKKPFNMPISFKINGLQKLSQLFSRKVVKKKAENYHRALPLIAAISNNKKDIVELLIANGANTNAECERGETPLLVAIYYNLKNIVELLINSGGDINAINKFGTTPLLGAIWDNQKDIVELLIARGVNINAVSKLSVEHNPIKIEITPLIAAIQRDKIDIVELLISKGVNINFFSKKIETPLKTAIIRNNLNMVELLLSNGADVHLKGNERYPPIFCAEYLGFRDIEYLLRRYEKNIPYVNFQNKYNSQYKATDGHRVRSRAELVIDNWLYNNRIFHEYEKYLPVVEKVLSDFYLPEHDIYIEFWGLEKDQNYSARKEEKLRIYKKYQFKLIELNDSDLLNLEDSLSYKLRELIKNN